METLCICVEMFWGTPNSLYGQTTDNQKNGPLAYVSEIQAESLLVGDEILKLASSDLNPPYSYGLYDPGTALIQSLSLDKVKIPYQEGLRRCGRVRVLSAKTAAGLWEVNEVAAAKTRFNNWLESSDEKKETPKNRHCALLQLCQNYAKERLNVLESIVAGAPANYGDSASDNLPSKNGKPKKSRRGKEERKEVVRAAVKYYYENEWRGVTQGDAEKQYELEQGALSKGYGKKMMAEYEMQLRTKSPVEKAVGDDFVFNETR